MSLDNNHSYLAVSSDVQMAPDGCGEIAGSLAISVPSAKMIVAGAELAQNRKTGGLDLPGKESLPIFNFGDRKAK